MTARTKNLGSVLNTCMCACMHKQRKLLETTQQGSLIFPLLTFCSPNFKYIMTKQGLITHCQNALPCQTARLNNTHWGQNTNIKFFSPNSLKKKNFPLLLFRGPYFPLDLCFLAKEIKGFTSRSNQHSLSQNPLFSLRIQVVSSPQPHFLHDNISLSREHFHVSVSLSLVYYFIISKQWNSNENQCTMLKQSISLNAI